MRPVLIGWWLLWRRAICGRPCRAQRVIAGGWLLRSRGFDRGFGRLRRCCGGACPGRLSSLRLWDVMARDQPDDDADEREANQEEAEDHAAVDWAVGDSDGSPAGRHWCRGFLKERGSRRLWSGSGLWCCGWLWSGRRLRGGCGKRRARWQCGPCRRYGRLRNCRRRRCRLCATARCRRCHRCICPSGSGLRLGCGSRRLS